MGQYACVYVSLYRAVHCFQAVPFVLAACKVHSALYVSLSGLQPRDFSLRPRRQRVIRPKGSGNLNALSSLQARLIAMLNVWQGGLVPVSVALQQFLDLLVSCADRQGFVGGATPPAPACDKSGFDERWHALAGVLNQSFAVWHARKGSMVVWRVAPRPELLFSRRGRYTRRAARRQYRSVYSAAKLSC